MYASDASMLAPGMPIVTGTDAIKQSMTGMMAAMKLNLRLYVEVLQRQTDKSWKMVADIWNPNSMPAAPAARPARRH